MSKLFRYISFATIALTCLNSYASITGSVQAARNLYRTKQGLSAIVHNANLDFYKTCTKVALTAATMEISGTQFNNIQSISFALLLIVSEETKKKFLTQGYSEEILSKIVMQTPPPGSYEVDMCLTKISQGLK